MDLPTLQEIQDSFASVANVKATITDADGNILTQPQPTREFVDRQNAIAQAEEVMQGPQREGREYVAPISVHGRQLGTIRMTTGGGGSGLDEAQITKLSERFGIDPKQLKLLIRGISQNSRSRAAAVQFVYLLGNAIARLCYQEYELRQRVNELTTVYNVAMLLSEPRDLRKLLDRTALAVAEVVDVKASSIRLLDREKHELVIKAVHNLSADYQNKGPVCMDAAGSHHGSLGPDGYEYVRDMARDPRSQYPQSAEQEGIVSMLSVGMRYKGKPVGVLRVYTAQERTFSPMEIDLLKAIAAQAAAAIENTRLLEESIAADQLERQVRMAADVQQRMLPLSAPPAHGVDLAHVYVPCYELAGDFFDFIDLPDENIGLVIADVSGKGLPASLIMASVRAALRAQVDNVYYLYEVVRRLNAMLCRDTRATEFVTLFYGVLDARNRRFTYCNAGHPPPLLYRDGKVTPLASDNLVLGINPNEGYVQNVLDLRPGDRLLMYTDGVPDAMDFDKQTFGNDRLIASYTAAAACDCSASHIVEQILWDVRRFRGLAERTDDLTMIALRVL